MPDHEGRAGGGVLDDGRDVVCVIVQVDAGHRPAALPDAARLRPQRAEAGGRKLFGDWIEIFRAAAERGEQRDERPIALREVVDLGVAVADDGTGE